jgi:hypothetical protein
MIRTIALSAALAFGFATASSAAILPAPVGPSSGLTIKVAEGCGPGFWRGEGGRCHPMVGPNRFCPPGYHIGREGHRCWPN